MGSDLYKRIISTGHSGVSGIKVVRRVRVRVWDLVLVRASVKGLGRECTQGERRTGHREYKQDGVQAARVIRSKYTIREQKGNIRGI